MPPHPFQDRVVPAKSFLQVHEQLSEAYRIKPPIALSRMVSFLFNLIYDNEYICPEDDLLNCVAPAFYLSVPLFEGDKADVGPVTPCEFFAFASPQVDGIDYGFVVHAPELPQEDFLVCELDPKDMVRGLRLLGKNFGEGLETLLSRGLSSRKKDANVWEQVTRGYQVNPEIIINRMSALATHLGLYPDAKKTKSKIFDSNGPEPKPTVPKGWKHVPSIDGVGVLAPALFFGEYQEELKELDTTYECDAEPIIDFANRALQDGYPASALLVLRDALFQNAYVEKVAKELVAPTKEAYLALNRPLFAALIEERSQEHWNT
jgi:hypothetical protein